MFEVNRRSALKMAAFAVAASSVAPVLAADAEVLPSWVDGEAKSQIVDFVAATTTEGGADFVEPADRVAVFDNDGTLWGEQPMYVQLAFVLDRVKQLAPQHPEWQTKEPFKSVLSGDMAGVAASGQKGLVELLAATHAGMSTEEFEKIVSDWIASARHPVSGKPYTAHIFQPMVELIDYLKAKEFKVFIVSGGGVEFMRPWTERVYGIPPENVVGSSIKTKYEPRNGVPAILRLPEVDFIDDGPGKPVGIHKFIGRRPIAAFGNSDGDFEMLEWTTSGPGRRFGLIVHHDDAERENAYDRDSHFGRLARGLDEAPARGWTIVSMKNDWKVIYPK
ncbi:haloacid dehalogenase-like hydrolase [Sinorhizobium meliloti]|uniref:HAD family hydrolase n=1 Tax=Rhizobium meliloti TaxID=382 RepID=UPI000FDB1F10|nr:HAD family hydrolase [Sinorhizobium meliloti]MDW9590301.1 haloacid dehalogenase-like hydrolase [Sinorhizobium meliloti]MDW9856783.1 haloacid dehalogenase-like hydrolase [Sinorhizobium meliloti]MDW9875377.1 haloacid dehalogenase-like hydrolase [Sinorhizobium meliloti]MDW9887555.1 haloacid dehalogenase-like hydrolase [Sinorhizobium meliloti]MDX0209760.1 haloacid dehalogenase-like hydrolase [Sinorhizobium meliloti]